MDEAVERIMQKMKAKGLDQKTLAKKIGIRYQAITEWKKGTTSSYTKYIQQLAEVLDTTADYLLLGDAPYTATISEKRKQSVQLMLQLTDKEQEKADAFVLGLIAGREEPQPQNQ